MGNERRGEGTEGEGESERGSEGRRRRCELVEIQFLTCRFFSLSSVLFFDPTAASG